MKVIKPSEVPQESADSPLFTGGRVTRQALVTPDMGDNFSINIVNFSAGARNKMHIHTSDQVLFVTAGKGIIATETAEEVITTGDVVHVSAGESTGTELRQTRPFPTSPSRPKGARPPRWSSSSPVPWRWSAVHCRAVERPMAAQATMTISGRAACGGAAAPRRHALGLDGKRSDGSGIER